MGGATRLLLLVGMLVCCLSAQEADKPDFSGTWQLDLLRTRFGDLPKPKSLTLEIEHRDPKIRIAAVSEDKGGETRETMDLTTDGAQYAHTAGGRSCTASARWHWWEGRRLSVDVQCGGVSRSRRFTMGAKGKILTTVLTVQDGSGEKKAYEFFIKR